VLQGKGSHGSDQKTATVLKGTGWQWWRGKHFIVYCEEEDHAQLLEELSKYRRKERLVSGAFSDAALKRHVFDSATWWSIYGRNLPKLQELATKCSQRCKPSSSSAERNWSIWGIVHSKLRNRLSLVKAQMLVYIYLRAIRKMTGNDVWSPLLNDKSENPEAADTDEFDEDELSKWWFDEFLQGEIPAITGIEDDDDEEEDEDDVPARRRGRLPGTFNS
jgi:hypothetical protein